MSLRALDLFYNKYARWPGESDNALEVDQLELFKEMRILCLEHLQLDPTLLGWSIDDDNDDAAENTACNTNTIPVAGVEGGNELLTKDHAMEMVRYGGIELHNISALIGGIAAQETIKILTHQFVPLKSTYIFNGIAACGATYDL